MLVIAESQGKDDRRSVAMDKSLIVPVHGHTKSVVDFVASSSFPVEATELFGEMINKKLAGMLVAAAYDERKATLSLSSFHASFVEFVLSPCFQSMVENFAKFCTKSTTLQEYRESLKRTAEEPDSACMDLKNGAKISRNLVLSVHHPYFACVVKFWKLRFLGHQGERQNIIVKPNLYQLVPLTGLAKKPIVYVAGWLIKRVRDDSKSVHLLETNFNNRNFVFASSQKTGLRQEIHVLGRISAHKW